MSRYTTLFVFAGLIYFTIGVILGVAMGFDPTLMGRLRAAHAHLNLLGFVSMFIYGVAYHALPRFAGQPLHSPRLAEFHLVFANVGLIGMVVSFALGGVGPAVGAFGTLELIGGLIFVYNIVRTVTPVARPSSSFQPIQPGSDNTPVAATAQPTSSRPHEKALTERNGTASKG